MVSMSIYLEMAGIIDASIIYRHTNVHIHYVAIGKTGAVEDINLVLSYPCRISCYRVVGRYVSVSNMTLL
jgi:hypothetical protein